MKSPVHPHTAAFPDASRIGLIADTHIPDRTSRLSPKIEEVFRDVHLILHAGDVSTPRVLEELKTVATPIAVRGNNRGDKHRFHPPLPQHLLVRVAGGYCIDLFHGLENPYQRITDTILGRSGLWKCCTQRLLRRMKSRFTDADCTVYGHGHWPVVHFDGNHLFINPGKTYSRKESSVGLLEVLEKNIRVKIIPLGEVGRIAYLTSAWHTFR